MQGLHLTADLHGCHCDSRWLLDAQALGRACIDAVDAAGLQAVAELFHTFPATGHGPGGVTATVLLAESHLCVHTWPEQRAVTLDVYVCNFGGDHSAKAQALLDAAGIAYEVEVAKGDPAHTIIDMSERFGCDLIVMGARGASALRSAMMGSVSNEVLHASAVPVVIVKPDEVG